MTLSYEQYQTEWETAIEAAVIAVGLDQRSFTPTVDIDNVHEDWLQWIAVHTQAQLWTTDVGDTALRRRIIQYAERLSKLRGTDAAFEEFGDMAGFTVTVVKHAKANASTPITLDFYITASTLSGNSTLWTQWVTRGLNYLIGSDVRIGNVYFVSASTFTEYRAGVVQTAEYTIV